MIKKKEQKETGDSEIQEVEPTSAASNGKPAKKRRGSKKKGQSDQLQTELDEIKDKYLRLLAEFDNFKKRTIKEKVDLRRSAAQDTMSVLLPVLDDFDRAKQTADDETTDEHFSDGVLLVYNKLHGALNARGLAPMDTASGVEFDPELHDALSEIPAPGDDQKGKIVDTIEKGYYLNEKIIRHAKVVVGK